MDKKGLFKKLSNLNTFNPDEYFVLSGASLLAHDIIKQTFDIDLACSKDLYNSINWPTKIGAFGKEIKYFDCFEISNNLYDEGKYFTDLIGGYKFVKLEKVLEEKIALNREKDLAVIEKLKTLLFK